MANHNAPKSSELAKRIRDLIKKQGLSQAEFASKVGVSQQQISNLLTGKRAWTQKTWESAAAALGVSPSDLFGGAAATNSDTVPIVLIFEKDDYRRICEEARKQMVDVTSFIKFAVAELVRRNGTKNQ